MLYKCFIFCSVRASPSTLAPIWSLCQTLALATACIEAAETGPVLGLGHWSGLVCSRHVRVLESVRSPPGFVTGILDIRYTYLRRVAGRTVDNVVFGLVAEFLGVVGVSASVTRHVDGGCVVYLAVDSSFVV